MSIEVTEGAASGPPERRGGLGAKLVSSYAVVAIQAVYALAITAYLIDRLGKPVFGGWVIVFSLMNIIRLLDLGIGPTTSRFVAAASSMAEINRVMASSMALLLGVAAVGILATIPLTAAAETLFGDIDGLQGAIAVASATSCALLPLGVFPNLLFGLDRIPARNVALILRSLAAAVAVVVTVEAGGGLFAIVAAGLGAEVLVAIGQVVYCARTVPGLRVARDQIEGATVRRLAPFSAGMLALSVAAQITYYSDALVIGAVLTAATAAVYAVAMRIVEGITLLINQFGDVFLPSFARLDAEGRTDATRQLLQMGTAVTLLFGYPLIAVAVGLGVPAIHAWVGDGFEAAWAPLALLAGGLAFTAPIRFGVLWAIGAARHGPIARIALLEAFGNLALSILLANLIGLRGVALSTLIALGISNGLLIPRLVYPELGLSTWREYHVPVLKAGVVAVGLAALLHLVVAPWLGDSILPVLLVGAAAYALGVVALAFVLGRFGLLGRGLAMLGAPRRRGSGAAA